MSKGQRLRDLVNERLTAAAVEIFALFERTISEYEEELCRCKEENQQLQSARLLHKDGATDQVQSPCPSPDQNQDITETQVKLEPDEPSVKLEEELLPLSFPESSAMCVKMEESLPLDGRQAEHREGTQGKHISEPHFHRDNDRNTDHSSDTDNDDNWEPRVSWSEEQIETEAGDQHNSVQRDIPPLSPQNMSGPETSAVNNGDVVRFSKGTDQYQCSVCQKTFTNEMNLERHFRVHTGELPHSCPICMKTFTRKFRLVGHMRTHTSEKPFNCSLCEKTFGRKDCLRNHMRTHTGEKPFSCSICKKAFADQSNLAVHRRIHTGEKPYHCTLCDKSYGHKGCLKAHMRAHTGEKLHSCSLCGKCFGKKAYLEIHMRCHTGEKPYICSICYKAFSVNSNLTRHMKSHEEGNQ